MPKHLSIKRKPSVVFFEIKNLIENLTNVAQFLK